MADKPVLYLIPVPLGAPETPALLPHERALLADLTDFVVEAEKTARAHLKHLGLKRPLRELSFCLLNEHTASAEIDGLLQPLREGRSLGLLSEAGCPAVADPGSQLVVRAHEAGFAVCPLVGPSSLLLALMASGANGQSFAFKGYLPTAAEERKGYLKVLERHAQETGETQIFIETPYRNQALLADALAVLQPQTRLTAACNLTLPDQMIVSRTVADWRQLVQLPDLHKKPTVFVLYAPPVSGGGRPRRRSGRKAA